MPRREKREEHERRVADLSAKVRRKGEFIHLDRKRPRLGSAEYVAPGTLADLERRGIVKVVQSDLLGRPYQYAAERKTRRIAR